MERENLHTENQPKGSARNPSDTLDREGETVAPGQRQWSDDSKRDPDEAERPQMKSPDTPSGTSGDGDTNHEQNR